MKRFLLWIISVALGVALLLAAVMGVVLIKILVIFILNLSIR